MAAIDITLVNTQPAIGGASTYTLSVTSSGTSILLQCAGYPNQGARTVQLIGTQAWGISNIVGQSYANSFPVAANTPITLKIQAGGATINLIASSTTSVITGWVLDQILSGNA